MICPVCQKAHMAYHEGEHMVEFDVVVYQDWFRCRNDECQHRIDLKNAVIVDKVALKEWYDVWLHLHNYVFNPLRLDMSKSGYERILDDMHKILRGVFM